MKRIAKGAVVLAAIPLLLVGLASAALAGGSAHRSGVSTMQPFNDGSWTPQGQGDSDAAYLVGRNLKGLAPLSGIGSGVSTMQPFNDGSWAPAAGQPDVITMQPFSDPNYPISVQQPSVGQPLSSPNCPSYPICGGSTAPTVTTMRPFSDPSYPIHAQPAGRPVAPSSPGSSLPLVALIAGLTAVVAAAGALSTLGRRKPLRPA